MSEGLVQRCGGDEAERYEQRQAKIWVLRGWGREVERGNRETRESKGQRDGLEIKDRPLCIS
jgi:hypothetical protein